MLTELELVLKNMSEGIEKVNAVNYLTKPPPLVHEYYYYEDAYVVNNQTVVSDLTPKAPIKKMCQGQDKQGQNYGNYN